MYHIAHTTCTKLKNKFLYLLIFLVQISLNAQLKVKNLSFNDLQYLDFLDNQFKTNNLRSEAIVDTVRPLIIIKMIKGNNPRCEGTNENFVFSATGYNWGLAGNVEWFVDNVLVGSGTTFSGTNYIDNTKINAKVTSTLNCAKPKNVLSNSITIVTASSLEATVSLKVISGNNPECLSNLSNITLQAVPNNGGSNPTFSWFINNTKVESIVGSNYTYNNTDAVAVRMISSLGGCISTATDTVKSSLFIRNYTPTINQLTSNPVELRLVSLTNSNCGQAKYNFEATAYRAGSNPVYNWFKNNSIIPNENGKLLSTTLENSGDEIQVKVTSSMSCINITTSSSNVFAKVDTLISLPFFDDFSNYRGSPDKNKWLKNGGTLISNTFSNNAPTHGLAIFDGLKYNGSAYDSINITNRGLADKLTSLPLDLSFYSNSDSLYIHFFWMYGGIGDMPEPSQGDKITLSFKDESGNYNEVWRAVPGSQTGVFFSASVSITNTTNSNYLYRGFQFQFQTSGRLSGQYDVWGLDYVVLIRNSTSTIPDYIDQAFSKQPLSILKNYQSMPYKHFNIDKINQLNTITSSLNNLNTVRNNTEINVSLIDAFDGSSLGELYDSTLILEGLTYNTPVLIATNPSFLPLIPPRNPYELKSVFSIKNNTNSQISGLPFAINNTIFGLTRFDNYYAYDDGSAEYIISNNAKNEHVAVKFSLPPNVLDTLKEIAFQFNKSNLQLIGQSFRIIVLKTLPKNGYVLNGSEVLLNTLMPIKYAPKVNGYTSFRLQKPIPISGNFYVGYTQISDGEILVGFDKNTDCSSNTVYTSGGKWDTLSVESPEAKGSIMIRPVFGFYNYETTALKEEKSINTFLLYPNPTFDGEFKIDVPHVLLNKELQIFNMQGMVLFAKFIVEEKNTIKTNLSSGIYLAKIGNKNTKICDIRLTCIVLDKKNTFISIKFYIKHRKIQIVFVMIFLYKL